MHIEPSLIEPAKMILAYATATGAAAYSLKLGRDSVKEQGVVSLAARTLATIVLVFSFFELLPHYQVGVSEVHFILGSTLFLIFGAAPAAIGLALGLLLQGLLMAPLDLPQYAANVTTLLVPLFAISAIAHKIIAPNTPYVDLKYRQALVLSTAYQGGVVAWVAFWAIYGQGFGVENLALVSAFGGAYMLVVLIEPVVGIVLLAGAKLVRGLGKTGLVSPRLYS